MGAIQAAGILDGFDEIRTMLDGIQSFFAKIADFTSFIGLASIILFLAILIISAGLSVLGLPRGKAAFILSLIIADSIWIAWEHSFNPGSYQYLQTLYKSNLILCIPLILVIAAAMLFPKVFSLLRKMKLRATGKSGTVLPMRDALVYYDEYQAARNDLETCLIRDVSRPDGDTVTISSETVESAIALKKTLALLTDRKDPGDQK